MKKILLLPIIVFMIFVTENVSGQGNFGKPYFSYSKQQRKNLKKFHKAKRHRRYIPFNNRSKVNHPSVTKESRRILRRRYNEDKFTRSNY